MAVTLEQRKSSFTQYPHYTIGSETGVYFGSLSGKQDQPSTPVRIDVISLNSDPELFQATAQARAAEYNLTHGDPRKAVRNLQKSDRRHPPHESSLQLLNILQTRELLSRTPKSQATHVDPVFSDKYDYLPGLSTTLVASDERKLDAGYSRQESLMGTLRIVWGTEEHALDLSSLMKEIPHAILEKPEHCIEFGRLALFYQYGENGRRLPRDPRLTSIFVETGKQMALDNNRCLMYSILSSRVRDHISHDAKIATYYQVGSHPDPTVEEVVQVAAKWPEYWLDDPHIYRIWSTPESQQYAQDFFSSSVR